MNHPFPWLLLPVFWGARNRARRRERGDGLRASLFGGMAIGVAATIFVVFFWLAWQLLDYEELGDYIVRLALGWLFLTFLSFVAFSGVVTSLSTFFLSQDMRLLVTTPIPAERLFHSRFARTVVQSSWMVAAFLLPLMLGVGLARCAPTSYYFIALATVLPFVVIPAALGALVTLGLVSLFPARRARDLLMLMGLLFAIVLVMLLRFIRPERLLSVQSLPDITAFFATLQSPITPLLPSFWASESLFSALRGHVDPLHMLTLWTTAFAVTILARIAYGRWHFAAWTKAQEARKARFTRLEVVERLLRRLPLTTGKRVLLVKDLKVFLRDTSQWSQLLLLVALALVYVYNFRVLDLDRIPYMSGLVKNAYAFVNLAMAAFVMSAVAVRFVFPAVSSEGPAFWLVRTAPIRLPVFLWSKFWAGFIPVLVFAEALTIVSNWLLGVAPLLSLGAAIAIAFMTLALVGLACGMGARYPRFRAESLTQVAGSYGGIAFMVIAVLFILAVVALLAWPTSTYLWHEYRGLPLPPRTRMAIVLATSSAATLCIGVFWSSMRRGARALEALG